MATLTDLTIKKVAKGQHGLVTVAQLREAGVRQGAIYRRVRRGTLRRVHRGVYRLGPVEAVRAREMAAVLACGPGAVVSHRSAAAMWSLVRSEARSAPVHVSVPERDVRRRTGLITHRLPDLPASQLTRLDGIPVTTPTRTIVDLAACASSRELERAVAMAEREGLADRDEITALACRRVRSPGAKALAMLLKTVEEPAFTRSEAEERLLGLVRGSGLPAPRVNAPVGGFEVDFLWERQRLVVEVDGYRYHRSRSSYENDRRRDAALARAGYQVIRVTWDQITTQSAATLVLLAQALVLTDPGR